jgi:PKD repeat protein
MSKRPPMSRIDDQVFITMIVLALLCLLIFGFRYATRITCAPVQLIMNAGSSQVNSPVTIRAVTKQATSFAWDMGDGNVVNETSSSITHTYKQPGRYTIKLLVNGSCEEFREIVITDAPEITFIDRKATFICKDTAYVNKPVTFEDTSISATSWEWRFKADGLVEGTRKKVQYTYYEPGRKLVTVKLNGREDMISQKYIDVIDPAQMQRNEDRKEKNNKRTADQTKVIMIDKNPVVPPIMPPAPKVEEKPVEPVKPAPKKIKDISTEELGNMLKGISEGNNTESDVAGFCCNSISVFYEGRTMLLSKACEELKQIKKGKIKRVEVKYSKDAETNCIVSMQIRVVKKFLGL